MIRKINIPFLIAFIIFAWAEYDCITSIGETAPEYKTPMIYPYLAMVLTLGLLFLGYFAKKVTESPVYLGRPKSIGEFMKRRHWILYVYVMAFTIPFFMSLKDVGKIVEAHTYQWTLPFNCALIFFTCFASGILTRIIEREKLEKLNEFHKWEETIWNKPTNKT